jgi:hypothetical protein
VQRVVRALKDMLRDYPDMPRDEAIRMLLAASG